MAYVVGIVVGFDIEVVYAVINPYNLAVCLDALLLGGGHRHLGRFVNLNKLWKILWMNVTGLIEDETLDQLRIAIASMVC